VVVVFYISGHGLGHASRDLELIAALTRAASDVRVVVRTSAPRWMFEKHEEIEFHGVEVDTGIAQIDSLLIDDAATARRAADFYREFDRRADEEAAAIEAAGAQLVVGDIPPLAFAAAARAGVPSIALGNFTWDWIYAGYPDFESAAPGVIETIQSAYGAAGRALRLPMHGGFEPMAGVTDDIPLIARRSNRDPGEIRRRLGLTGDRPIVLASFGGYGVELPFAAIGDAERLAIVVVERHPPAGVTYPDLVAAADVVVSKPGYGIISECVANRTALVYTSRGRFREYDVLVAWMPRMLRCGFVSVDDLRAGRWAAAIRGVLVQPEPDEQPRVDGAAVAAAAILDLSRGESLSS
jgi:L-arabinokinase